MTPEQKQRIEQVADRHEHNKSAASDHAIPKYLETAYADIDFLLSLVKRQETGDGGDVRVLNQIRERAADGYERASGGSEVKAANLALNDLHYVLSSHDGQFARGATSMRSACVEKVRESLYDPSLRFSDEGIKAAVTDWTNILIKQLESVSIQEQEPQETDTQPILNLTPKE